MKRVLKYGNRKTDDCYWDASTSELEAGAFLALFKVLDESWQVYGGLEEKEQLLERTSNHVEGCMCDSCKAFRREERNIPGREKERLEHLDLYKKAKKGDALAARKLLTLRKDYEYETFSFVQVDSATAAYPPRVWGVEKPCGEVFVCENGLYKWGNHGRVETRELREKIHEFGYRPGQKGALEYLTKGGILHFDLKSKTVVDLGDEVWTFRPRGKDKEGKVWDDGEWMYQGLCAEAEHAKTGIPLLEQGTFNPGKVIRLTQQVCGGCRRDLKRFGSDD